jgi:hypothetical protein
MEGLMPEQKIRAVAARAVGEDPGTGSDDCYNRVSRICNELLPGKDMGDAEYRHCISSGLDWCDTYEPTRVSAFPLFEAGRFQAVATARTADGGPDRGPDDCYKRVTQTCNARYPGKDIGDKEYRDCINAGLDWCDVYEPSRVHAFPVLDAGRFEVVSSRRQGS